MRRQCQFTVKRSPKCAVRSVATATAASAAASAIASAATASNTFKVCKSEHSNAEYYKHPNRKNGSSSVRLAKRNPDVRPFDEGKCC